MGPSGIGADKRLDGLWKMALDLLEVSWSIQRVEPWVMEISEDFRLEWILVAVEGTEGDQR